MMGDAGVASAAVDAPAEVGVGRLVLASLIGTAIEFYDFYIYGTAAALVIGQTFFPQSAPQTQALNAFLTFGVAFLARPVGAFLFGHFGDRVGRKATLVATMVVMGLSTTLIGLLPGYATAGALAPWLLCILRFGQGVGLGGEWGGAALLAVENAPHGRRAWFGMFPQLGPPIGFLMANGLFLLLILGLGEQSFVAWAWRVPFLLSAALVAIGLYVRVTIAETPAFRALLAKRQRAEVPLVEAVRDHWRPLIQGSLAIVVCYALFYVSTVFALGYGVTTLHIARTDFLAMLCVAALFMAAATPISAGLADRFGRRPVLLAAAIVAAAVGLAMPALFAARQPWRARLPVHRAGGDGADLRAARRAAAGALPRPRSLHRRIERLQSRRHSRRLARADDRPTAAGARRRRLGRLLHRRRRGGELRQSAHHLGNPGIGWRDGFAVRLTAPALRPPRIAASAGRQAETPNIARSPSMRLGRCRASPSVDRNASDH